MPVSTRYRVAGARVEVVEFGWLTAQPAPETIAGCVAQLVEAAAADPESPGLVGEFDEHGRTVPDDEAAAFRVVVRRGGAE